MLSNEHTWRRGVQSGEMRQPPEKAVLKVHQAGISIILETSEPTHHRIAIPDHRSLRIGTFSAILRAVARHKGVERDPILADL